ncbi:uncharacterized protein [Bombus fervidus]|uniref:uncharacterized protein n=1 Tax=Bombus fervidus TaxID=203811 RepID=UPI003D18D046
MEKSLIGLVRQVDAIWPKLGKNGIRASQLKVGAEECSSSRWRAGDEKNIAKLGVRTLIPTRRYQPRAIHGGIASDTYTLELFRKSDNENTLRYTLVPEDIPIGKVYQKVQQLQQLVGVTLS